MKTILGTVVGLLSGAIFSSFFTACMCPTHADMPPGTYITGEAEADYQLIVGTDNHVTESYTRGGKRYVVKYVATP